MYFLYELAGGFQFLADKPNQRTESHICADDWYMREGTRSFYRRCGHVCSAMATAMDRISIWRARAAAVLASSFRRMPAGAP